MNSVLLLSNVIFSVISKFILDGKTAVKYSRVCGKWKEYIYGNPRLKRYIDIHYIKAENENELRNAFFPYENICHINTESSYCELKLRSATTYSVDIIIGYQNSTNDFLFDMFDLKYEETPQYFITNSCELVVNNDYYDEHYSLEKFEKMLEVLNKMKSSIEKTDFTWKYIKFPKLIEGFYLINGCKYHRGTSLQLIFKKKEKEEEEQPDNKKIKIK